jgi:hypothetical protein
MAKTNFLSSIMESLIERAQAEHRPARYQLGHGLEVVVLILNGRLYIQLMRPTAPGPSARELATVLDNLKFNPEIEYTRHFESDGNHYLRCEIVWPPRKPPEADSQAKQERMI